MTRQRFLSEVHASFSGSELEGSLSEDNDKENLWSDGRNSEHLHFYLKIWHHTD